MSLQPESNGARHASSEQVSLGFLHASQVAMIDEALAAVGDFGEVHLIVENRRLRFVVTQRSCDVHKWQPGVLAGQQKRSE
jgi:hypothetical protein